MVKNKPCMDNQFSIRTATLEDVPTIRALSHAIWPLVYRDMIGLDQIDYMLSWMYNEAELSKQISEYGITFIIIQGVSPFGFAAYGPGNNDRYKLHKLYVHPDFHGLGIGRQLVEHIWKLLPTTCTGLELQVNKNNSSLLFYQKLGFTIEQSQVFDIGNGYVMDDYIMYKSTIR
jgi:diamine N-acetyltransferase